MTIVSMGYCLNPACKHPQNSPQQQFCQSCGTKLLLRERYRAIKPIGQGGFGKTFLGVDGDKPSKPPCVIKLFYPSSKGTDSIRKATQLFNQKAERLDSLGRHPQIPELLAHFEQESKLYLVQEYIEGQNIAQILQEEGTFSEAQIRELLTELLSVLQFIHENNVIHRDIKPENIIKRNNKGYVLVDFGAARYVTGTALLKTGTVIGDVRYMPDEQLQGKAIFASDIYSLGLTCLHLLTGVEPWSLFDSSEGEWIWRDYLTTSVSEELGQVLDRMVQKATKRRFESTVKVLDVLNPSGVEMAIQSPTVETPSVSSEVSSSHELVRFELDGKYGYKDETGKIVIQPQFDNARHFDEGLAGVQINGKWGFIDKTGKIVIQRQFDDAENFEEGLARVRNNWKWGFIDTTGKIVIPVQFDSASCFSEGLVAVQINKKWGYIDKTGRVIIKPQFNKAESFENGVAKVETTSFLKHFAKKGYIDKQGKWIN